MKLQGKPVSLWLLCCSIVALIGCLPVSHALAQVDPGVLLEQQRKMEEQKKKQEQITQPGAPPQIEKPAVPHRPPTNGGVKIKVTQFKFSGNNVIKTEELEKVIAHSIGKELTVKELIQVANQVSEYYVGRGYIVAQAYIPVQRSRGGIVEIAILEGKLGKVDVTGNARYKSSTILRQMERLKREGVIHDSTLETALYELNDYPGLKVRATLQSGEDVGLTDVALTAKERLPYTFKADINNYGSRLTGPWQYSGEIGAGNLLGLGDNLSLKGTKSNSVLFLTNMNLLVPVTSFGTKLQATWIHSEAVVGKEFGALRPTALMDIASMDILQTFTRTADLSLTGVGGFDFKTFRTQILGALSSKDELRVFRLGIRGDYRDPYLGRNFFSLTWHRGVDFWGGSSPNAPGTSFAITQNGVTRGAGPGNWSKGTADLSRFQSLGLPFLQGLPVIPAVLNDSYLILRATGQLASDRMLSPERFAIGGYYTVRGYQVAELIGDNGYAATAELVVPVPSNAKVPFSPSKTWKEMFQVAVFVDHGGTFASPVTGQGKGGFGYLTSAGGGLRINVPFGLPEPADLGALALKIDWASAIGRPRPSSRDQGLTIHPITGAGDAGVLYFSAAMSF